MRRCDLHLVNYDLADHCVSYSKNKKRKQKGMLHPVKNTTEQQTMLKILKS